ncbi:MAG: hypothetical protein OXD38_05995 [Aestuariivita sp.]|nr:hypothetical protein [Aestuariivita sp.]
MGVSGGRATLSERSFSGLAHTTMEDRDKPYETLQVEHSIPAGLKAQLFEIYAKAVGLKALRVALDSVMQ